MSQPDHKHWKTLQPLIQTMPDKPGIYQYFDERGTILYVGKAKNLKKRVSSYFNRSQADSGKVRMMVRRIADIQHFVVDTELDALLLENNLIKKYQPRYNVLMKDDKTFPWICIKKEPFPRIFPTRNLIRDGSKYFGPYASVRMMHTLLELIRQLFQYRTCRLNLTSDNILAGKFKRCLEFHIGNCRGPCEGLQSEADYMITIGQVEDILRGNLSSVIGQLRQLMKSYAEEFAYEKAHVVKEKLHLLEKFQSKSMVVSSAIHNVDVYTIVSDQETGYVNFLKVVDGAIVQSHTLEIRKRLDESDVELIEIAIMELKQRFQSNAREVIVPFRLDVPLPDVKFVVPKIGDKKKLLELSARNAKYYRLEKLKQRELVDPERHTKRILDKMKQDLRLPQLPSYIECFDNSNTQGSYPVAAMVVFRQTRPSKKEYRHYNIKTVEGPNDFASMEEVVYRRYKRLLDEGQELPQLVVVDGGKGQLSSAVSALEKLGLRKKIAVIGIAKRLEEIFFPGDSLPIYIDKKSETLKIIQYMRDEAHRFGIKHHRGRREKGSMSSELNNIKGIGPKTIEQLLQTFRSVSGIRSVGYDAVAAKIGSAKAKALWEGLNDK
jgi:excinuclease ABC subunit C